VEPARAIVMVSSEVATSARARLLQVRRSHALEVSNAPLYAAHADGEGEGALGVRMATQRKE
jgi:hypothetical protein